MPTKWRVGYPILPHLLPFYQHAATKDYFTMLLQYDDEVKLSCHNDASSSSPTNTQTLIPSTVAILPRHTQMLQLTATIASLWNCGVLHVAVAGIAVNI
mmetsp:Transcript_14978/g.27257  ORF Transcript_14978/g.27257 Transcript_14978/m.27257 type:complete len:99 (+) Transcript_14978:149-445(+)